MANAFINEYLPVMNGDVVRVYLYGLYLCGGATRYDNTLDHFARTLGMPCEDVLGAFYYMGELGLVQVLTIEPVEVRYLPIKSGLHKIKKFAKGKYDEFNAQVQTLVEGRMITPTEFAEYYSLMEYMHIEPAALVMMVKYCVDLKGVNVGAAYILTVAKNWAYAGVKTVEAVTDRLQQQSTESECVVKILKALGIKRSPEPEDFELYKKWRERLGYSDEVITHVAKKCKGGVSRLDVALMKYFELKLFEIAEIKHYEANKDDLRALAIGINKKIGVYYENVDNIIETYISNWQLKGFDAETLLCIADFCFRSGVRTLEGMDKAITRFYKEGATNIAAVTGILADKVERDKDIKAVLEKLGLTRAVTTFDRDFYHNWTVNWSTPPEIIDYAISLCRDKVSPMAYLNRMLASFFEKKITTVDAAKSAGGAALPQSKVMIKHSYTDDELGRVLVNLAEEDF